MKKTNHFYRFCALALSCLLLISLLPVTQVLAEGDGAIHIKSAEDLRSLAHSCTLDSWSRGKTVVLDNDIELTDDDELPIPTFGGTFNGNGHTISNFSCSYRSYPSFFGVLYGTVRNVTFLNPYINGGSAAGVIGGYIGTKTLYAHVSGVRVIGARIYETGTYGVGGIGGRLGGPDCVIENCYVNGQIESTYKDGAAGLIGGENETATVTIRNCFTEGSVKAKLTAGGILGEFWRPNAGIYNCASTASIEGVWAVGGIVGRATGWSSNFKATVHNKVVNCIAWNDKIRATNADGNPAHYSSGAIVGFTAIYNTHTDGYRKYDLDFKDYPALADINQLVDQPNSDADNPLLVGTSNLASGMYCYPYHGKAAGKDETLCDVARRLGWDETIWDLSGDKPVLK